MELGYARRLLLDFGKGSPYLVIQATGKKEKERKKKKEKNLILCVLNTELT